MMLTVWLVVGVGALLLLAVLGYGLFGHANRLLHAVKDAQSAVAPQVAELTQGIQRAQATRMHDRADTSRGLGRHA
ncbi:MAG: hypothetical protein M3400_06345 [Actinomycetota bacterium]|nr:hypothetical protein [Actinomycetota bacterium]